MWGLAPLKLVIGCLKRTLIQRDPAGLADLWSLKVREDGNLVPAPNPGIPAVGIVDGPVL